MSYTTDPNDPRLGHGSDDKPVPMNEVYLVLSEEECAKGFVRSLRRSYLHRGRHVCGQYIPNNDGKLGGQVRVCMLPPDHDGTCGTVSRTFVQPEAARIHEKQLIGGCNEVTQMGLELCETYARKPDFYGSTYCVHCSKHLPVNEFVWCEDGVEVGK